jgi:hypothetical protein
MRTASLIMLSGLFVQIAHADEIRHTTFPNVMLGTWAETAEQCAAKDKTNIVIQPTKYRHGGGDCEVRWIVETAGSGGTNYAVHSLLHQRIAAGEDPNQRHHRAAAWPRSRRDGTIVRGFKELSALSVTIAQAMSVLCTR